MAISHKLCSPLVHREVWSHLLASATQMGQRVVYRDRWTAAGSLSSSSKRGCHRRRQPQPHCRPSPSLSFRQVQSSQRAPTKLQPSFLFFLPPSPRQSTAVGIKLWQRVYLTRLYLIARNIADDAVRSQCLTRCPPRLVRVIDDTLRRLLKMISLSLSL